MNFNIVFSFQINEYFWGYEDFVDIFGGHRKTGLVLIRGHFYAFYGIFLGSRYVCFCSNPLYVYDVRMVYIVNFVFIE